MAILKAAAIHDLSGLGKCSLTAAIPVLSVMGIQPCPLPTAVYSNQTGFSSFSCVDFTPYTKPFLEEWKKRNVYFDGIYTGFFCSPIQVDSAIEMIDEFHQEDTLVLVDPVLGDNGNRYPVYPPGMVEAVRRLIRNGSCITPNLTEACLLTGSSYSSACRQTPNSLLDLAKQLSELGPDKVIITGIAKDDGIYNIGWDRMERECVITRSKRYGAGYSGTGDLLASVMCGGLLRGDGLAASLRLASGFLEASVADTFANGTDPNEGVAFERHLSMLANPYHRNKTGGIST